MQNAVSWFEIPTVDIARATSFYEKVLGVSLKSETFMGVPHAIFPRDSAPESAGVTGTLIEDAKRKPGAGTVVYLTVGDLAACLGRVAGAGGTVTVPSTELPMGAYAILRDTEGNHVGLFAGKS